MIERRNSGLRLAGALLACAVVALAGGCAGALGSSEASDRDRLKPRVVVLEIEGERSAAVRTRLVRLLADRYELVPRKRYHQMARRLEATSMQPYDVSMVSAELGLDAIVEGSLRKGKRRRTELALTLYDAVNGKVLDELEVTLRSGKLVGKARHDARTGLYGQLDELTPVGDVTRGDDERALASADDDEADEEDRASREGRGERAAKASRSERRARRAAARAKEREREERARARREARAEARRDRARGGRERAQRDRSRRAEREETRRGRRDREVARAEPEEPEESYEIETSRDDQGQAIDDEMPDILR